MNRVWTESEKEFLRQNAGIMRDSDMAATLTRICCRHVSRISIKRARQRLGLIKKISGRGHVCPLLNKQED